MFLPHGPRPHIAPRCAITAAWFLVECGCNAEQHNGRGLSLPYRMRQSKASSWRALAACFECFECFHDSTSASTSALASKYQPQPQPQSQPQSQPRRPHAMNLSAYDASQWLQTNTDTLSVQQDQQAAYLRSTHGVTPQTSTWARDARPRPDAV